MNEIRSYINNTIPYTRTALTFCAKAAMLTTAKISLHLIFKASGLDTLLGEPLTAIAKKLQFVATPLKESSTAMEKIMGYITPPLYYTSHHLIPGMSSEDCHLTRTDDPPEYECKFLSSPIRAVFTEELLTRGLLQRNLLPWMARQLPSPLRRALNHKVTRVILSSLVFASAHSYKNVLSPFISGIVYGAAAEITDSLKIPLLAHLINNGLILLLFAKTP